MVKRTVFAGGALVSALSLLFAAPGIVVAQGRTDSAVSFARDVLPVLTKAGCNAGTCHGSLQGRGGFRLSLLGFDPQADYAAITKEGRGRRVSPASVERSLLLAKPSGAVPHVGGLRFAVETESYRVLRDWIEAGLAGTSDDEAQLDRLDIAADNATSPKTGDGVLTMSLSERVALRTSATWSDGVSRDVTQWALFSPADEEVVSVSDAGIVTAEGPGQSAIIARYGGAAVAIAVAVPYQRQAPLPTTPQHNFIDQLARDQWERLGVSPGPVCDDSSFLRRVSLDLIGTLPTPQQVREFTASAELDKRSKLIDALLDRPEYVDYWSLRWSDLLRAHRRFLGEKGLASFHSWLREQFRHNTGIDEIARQLLTARGNLYVNGPVAYYFVDQKPAELAETTAQVFLGVRLQCARCHHHPFEDWSQEDYYSLAAFFANVQRKDSKESGSFGGAQAVLIGGDGAVSLPDSSTPLPPRTLGGQPLADNADDPRGELADWITSADNPFFARSIANRYWGYLFGRGLVHPVDDLRATNPASHPQLLDALATDLAANRFDLKHLLRTICNSHTYQLAAELSPTRDREAVLLTHHRPRRLSAEVLLDAFNQATGVDEQFPNLPAGVRAIELADPAIVSGFLDIFGRAKRNTACECERILRPDLRQAMHLSNNEGLSTKIASPEGRLAKLLQAETSEEQIVEQLYLAALSREPTADERQAVREFLAEAPSRREAWEDVLWTLINCTEFSFTR
jgi:hypothetical protein